MMTLENLTTPYREIYGLINMLLLVLETSLTLAYFRLGKEKGLRFLCLMQAGVTFVVYTLFIYATYPVIYFKESPVIDSFTLVLRGLPLAGVAVFDLISATIFLTLGVRYRRLRSESPTVDSIKEAIDLLPVGITFADECGRILLSNLTMNSLVMAITGKPFTDINQLNAATSEIFHSGESTWQFSRESLEVDERLVTQITATDVSEQARIGRELALKNAKLTELHLRLDNYNKEAEKIIIEQELLSARMLVHSEAGHMLLSCRHYLEHPETIDEEGLLEALRRTNEYLLKEYEEDDTVRDTLMEALDRAGSIGIRVSMAGMIPEGGEIRSILGAAINECSTNVRKHAGGDSLEVHVDRLDNGVRILLISKNNQIENNSRADNTEKTSEAEKSDKTGMIAVNRKDKRKTVAETGGLKNLRVMVEQSGGKMAVTAGDSFVVEIII